MSVRVHTGDAYRSTTMSVFNASETAQDGKGPSGTVCKWDSAECDWAKWESAEWAPASPRRSGSSVRADGSWAVRLHTSPAPRGTRAGASACKQAHFAPFNGSSGTQEWTREEQRGSVASKVASGATGLRRKPSTACSSASVAWRTKWSI